jgi:peptide/nickel transport system substrate-binding protein
MLEPLVQAGTLPPVEERLPENPCVYPVYEMLGKHGGTWRRGFTGPTDGNTSTVTNCSLTHTVWEGLGTRANLCESWERSEDGMTFTIRLRKGTKWSDGAPFTTADMVWWYENQIKNSTLTAGIPTRYRTGTPPVLMELEALDDYTVVLTFAHPFPLFMHWMNINYPFVPAHYMKQFHMDFTDDKDALAKAVSDAGWNSWDEYYHDRNDWVRNPELPTTRVWLPVSDATSELFVLERNPYFVGVDEAGLQLPYIDKVTFRLHETLDVFNMWIINGEIDMQGSNIDVANYTLFKENEENGDYRVLKWITQLDDTFYPNHDCRDPRLAAFFQKRDVRIAMSVAMDRQTIVDIAYDGLAVAKNGGPAIVSPEHHEKSSFQYAEYDPDRANELLDALGYTERDAEGYRLWDDGSGETISFIIDMWFTGSAQDAAGMAVQYLADVGLKASLNIMQSTLYNERANSNQHDAQWEYGTSKLNNFFVPEHVYVAEVRGRNCFGGWTLWNLNRDDPNGHEPPEGHFLWTLWELWEKAKVEVDDKQRLAYFHQMMDIWADEVPAIGITGDKVGPIICKNGFMNMGEGFPFANNIHHDVILGSPTFFWDDPAAHSG